MSLSPEFSVVSSSHLISSPVLIHLNEAADKEEILAKRYQRKKIFQQDVVCEFTRDPGLLHQYYEIRNNEYNAVYEKFFVCSNFSNNADNEYDRNGHIMVIRKGNFCVGGVRINTKTPRKPDLLPVETPEFRIENFFPELKHKELSYAQVSGFSLLPEFRGGETTFKMIQNIYRKALALNIDVIFGDTSPLHARLYQTHCRTLGLKDAKIHYSIKIPDPQVQQILFSVITQPFDDNNSNLKVKSNNQVIKAETESF